MRIASGGVECPTDATTTQRPSADRPPVPQQHRSTRSPRRTGPPLWGSFLVGAISVGCCSVASATPFPPPAASPVPDRPARPASLNLAPSPLAPPSLPQLELAQQFRPPNTGDLPGRRQGGGTRGGALDRRFPVALIPDSNLGLTTRDRPMLYFYIPPEATEREAELFLINETGSGEGSQLMTLPATPGVIGLPLPDSMPPLQVGDTYRWYFAVRINPVDRSGDLILSGFVQRVAADPALQQELSASAAAAHATIYAERGLWFDAMNLLAMLRLEQPNQAQWQEQWATLLQSVNLAAIAEQPLLGVLPTDTEPLAQTPAAAPQPAIPEAAPSPRE